MSLINDALKRTIQAQPTNPSPPAPEAPMQPVEKPQRVGLPVYFPPAMVLIICGACWFLLKGWETRRQAGLYPQPIILQARELPSPVPVPERPTPVPAQEPQAAVPTERQFALNDGSTSSPPSALTEASRTTPAVPTEPTFKLQGIFYRPSNPSAVVNSKTVFIGDIIANAKVKAIDRQTVTLEVGGETKVLTLQ